MARHRFDDNDNDKKWGGPELAERAEAQPQRHGQHRENAQSRDSDKERTQPHQR